MSAPLCRYCGKAIAKRTSTVWLRTMAQAEKYPSVVSGDLIVDRLPQSIEECRKITNRHVVSVRRMTAERGGAIYRFNEWDGESYKDEFFCNDEHARAMGYAAARGGQVMPAYNKAKESAR